jgi:hypothetical protein
MASPKIGDRGYEVEWIIDLPQDEHGDTDFDAATYRDCILKTHEAALAHAKKVFPTAVSGYVVITPVEFSDIYEWEHHGPVEYYEGEDNG